MVTDIKVGEVMKRAVITVKPEDSITKVITIMKEADIGGVIVLKNKRIAGVLTEGDIIKKVLAKKRNYKKTIVKEIMSHPVRTINPNEDLEEVAKIMRDLRIERLPVVQNNHLVGLITERDLTLMEPALLELIQTKGDLKAYPTPEFATIAGSCENCGNFSEALVIIEKRYLCENCR